MPDQLQLRGGTTTEHNSFTGAAREVTVDTTKKTLVVHDGSQAGGTPLMKESGATAASSVQIGTGGVERFKITNNEVVFNETSTDTDFRIEGNGAANLFKVDAGNDRIGIGTGSPATQFHVSSGSDTIIRVTSGDGNAAFLDLGDASDPDGGRIHYDSGSNLVFNTASTEKMRISSIGRVGIGTSSPSTVVHINDIDAELTIERTGTHSTSSAPLIQFKGRGPNATLYNFAKIDAVSTGSNNAGHLRFYTNESGVQAEKMRIDSGGRVLFNMTTPLDTIAGSLNISGGTSGGRIAMQGNTTSAGAGIAEWFAHWTTNKVAGYIARSGTDTTNKDEGELGFFTRGSSGTLTERLTLDQEGNIGIGTQTPAAGSLHIHLTETPELNLMSTQHSQNNNCKINFGIGQSASVSGNTGARIEMNIPNAGGQMNGDLRFFTNSGDNLQERMRIDASGRVIVGGSTHIGGAQFVVMGGNINSYGAMAIGNKVTNPTAGTSISQFRFNSGSQGTRRGAEIVVQADGNWTDGSSHPTRMFFSTVDTNATGATERMRIHSNGSISVGVNQNNGIFCVSEPTATHSKSVRFKASTSSGLSNTTAALIDIHGFYSNNYNAFGLTFINGDDGANTTRSAKAIQFVNVSGSEVGSIQQNQNSTSFNTSSDYRLKENATAISDGITRLKTLKPYRFNFKGQTQVVDGFFAHEVTAVPEAITGVKDEMEPETRYEEGDTIPSGKAIGDAKTYSSTKMKLQSIDQSKLVPLLVAAVQELIGKVETLEAA